MNVQQNGSESTIELEDALQHVEDQVASLTLGIRGLAVALELESEGSRPLSTPVTSLVSVGQAIEEGIGELRRRLERRRHEAKASSAVTSSAPPEESRGPRWRNIESSLRMIEQHRELAMWALNGRLDTEADEIEVFSLPFSGIEAMIREIRTELARGEGAGAEAVQ